MSIGEIINKLKTMEHYLKIISLDPDLFKFEPKYSDIFVQVSAGYTKKIIKVREEGILNLLNITTTSKDTNIIVYIDDNRIEGKPSDIYEEGMTFYNPRSFWISKYDEINNEFSVWFTPMPYIHYYRKIEVTIGAPENKSISYKYKLYRYVRR